MTKRLMAALTALMMCAALASCGKGAEDSEESSAAKAGTASAAEEDSSEGDAEESKAEGSSSEEEKTAGTDASDESSALGEAQTSSGDSGSGTGETQSVGDYDITLTGGNIIRFDEAGLEAQPTDDEISKMIAAATAQYRAAESGDLQAFLDSFNLDIIRDTMIELTYEGKDIVIGDEFDEFIAGREVKFEILDNISDLLMDIGDEDILREIRDTDDPDYDEVSRLINAVFDSINTDRDYDDGLYYYTIWDSDLVPMGEPTDMTTYAIIVYSYEDHGDEMYCRFDMLAVDGSFEYYLDGVDVWCIDGEYGVYVESAGYFESEEYNEMTAQQIYDMMMEEMSQTDILM